MTFLPLELWSTERVFSRSRDMAMHSMFATIATNVINRSEIERFNLGLET